VKEAGAMKSGSEMDPIEQVCDRYLDGDMTPEEVAGFERRLSASREAMDALNRERRRRELLRGMPIEPMSADFVDRALGAARRRQRTRYAQKAAIGLAASFVLAVLVLLRPGGSGLEPPPQVAARVATVVISMGQPEVIRLRIRSNQDVQNVRFDVQLPEHLRFASAGRERSVQWSGGLKQGVNVLDLPVVAQAAADGQIVARVGAGQDAREFRLAVEVRPRERAI